MKYNIENNIDFYKELYTSLNNDKLETNIHLDVDVDNSFNNKVVNIDTDYENNDFCLITHLPLTERFVELNCGHKFNYEPLYKDIFNHKKKFNYLEQIKTKLKHNQIRCPYCRNIQDELLPYYDDYPYPKEHGINFFDITKLNMLSDYINPNNQCQYNITNTDVSGNTFIHQCNHYGYSHYMLKTKYNNSTKYCYTHKLVVVKQIRDSIKEQLKKEKLEIKMKKIEEKNKLKIELKEKKNAEKLLNKNKSCENIILSNTNVIQKDNLFAHDNNNNNNNSNIEMVGCIEILKSGKRKNSHCSLNIYKDSLCKRHFNIKNI